MCANFSRPLPACSATEQRRRKGQGQRQGQGKAGQDREAWDQAKGSALGDTGHSALQDKAKAWWMIDCGTGRRAGQSVRQDRERGMILR